MPDKRPKHDQHNPSQKSLQRWDNEGSATKRSRAKRPWDFSQAAKPVLGLPRVPPYPKEQAKPSTKNPEQLGKEKNTPPAPYQKRKHKKAAKTRWKTAAHSE